MPQLFTLPQVVPLSSLGAILPGAKLYFFQTGTSTPQNVYQDFNLTVAHSQPVVADGAGVFAKIYLDGGAPSYRVRLTDANEVQLWQLDDVPSSGNLVQLLRVKGATPEIILEETDAAADFKKTRIRVASTQVEISFLNDAESIAGDIVTVSRLSSTTPGTVAWNVQPGNFTLSGNQALAGLHRYKQATESRSSTTTLTGDTHLLFTLRPSTNYAMELYLIFDTTTGGAGGMGFKFDVEYSQALNQQSNPIVHSYVNGSGAVSILSGFPSTPATFATLTETASANILRAAWGIRTGSSVTIASLRWAQNSSNANNLNVRLGSWFRAQAVT